MSKRQQPINTNNQKTSRGRLCTVINNRLAPNFLIPHSSRKTENELNKDYQRSAINLTFFYFKKSNQDTSKY